MSSLHGHIFISYSSKSRAVVEPLAAELDLFEYKVWFDPELDNQGGHKWWSLILEKIRTCHVFVFAMTTHALQSVSCRAEYEYAFALNKRILPVRLEDIDMRAVPPKLLSLQIVDYRQQSHPQRRALRDSVKNLYLLTSLPMPHPLPTEPPLPLDPVAALMAKVNERSLNMEEQKLLLREIEDFAEVPEHHADVELLLIILERVHGDNLTGRSLKNIARLREELRATLPSLTAQEYFNRGLIRSDNSDAKIADYTEAIHLKPDFAEAYYNRAIAYHAKGDQANATADYLRCLELNPTHLQAKMMRDYIAQSGKR